ncbi:ABC transporter permease [Tumebacillus permanentifrigoris]|uniref:ABC transporter permease n=1 Tax=Tumebacillus permanentifrigoris TaxID=378543 RepID=UPI001474B353|nr:ABC transporter permease [Tumebacillus permanentifrigoris]
MKIGLIAWKDTLIRLRDWKVLLIMLLMPILLSMILGSALAGQTNADAMSLPDMTVATFDGHGGGFSEGLLDGLLGGPKLKDKLTLVKMASPEEVKSAVEAQKVDVGIVIESKKIRVLRDPGKPTSGQFVQTLTESYVLRVGAVATSTKVVVKERSNSIPASQVGEVDFAKMASAVADQLKPVAISPNASVLETPIGEKAVSAKQYYAVAMTAMFLLYNVAIGAKSILNERGTETLARMMVSPTSKSSILLGKFVGTLLYSMIQFVVMVLATRFIFGVEWGGNGAQVLVLGLMYAVAVAGLSMMIASMISSEKVADLVSGIGALIAAVLGGSIVPLSEFPDLMQKLSLVTPNAWALNGLLDIMSGTTWQALWLPMLMLLGMGTVTLCVGTWRLAAR